MLPIWFPITRSPTLNIHRTDAPFGPEKQSEFAVWDGIL